VNGVVDADFADLGTYRAFVDEIVGRRNANKLERARPREGDRENTWNMSGATGSIEASRSKTTSNRRQSSRATCPKRSPTFTPFGVGAEKSCNRSGYCVGQRVKIG
jgi:hypothetical protein